MASHTRNEGSRARDVRLVRAIVHEAGNLLAAVRLSGHFLGRDLAVGERVGMSRDIELLAGQAGALLAQIRPLLAGSADHRGRVPTSALLEGIAGVVDGGVAEGRLKVASGRALPDVRVDADAVHQLLVLLVSAALAESQPDRRVQVKARSEGRRVILSVLDEGRRLEKPSAKAAGRGRELTLAVADAVLRESGGRLSLAERRRGNEVELRLPAVTAQPRAKVAKRTRKATAGR